MRASVFQDVITGKYDALLLGGEFSNCHGSGDTEEAALMSLRMLVNLKRRQRDKANATDAG